MIILKLKEAMMEQISSIGRVEGHATTGLEQTYILYR